MVSDEEIFQSYHDLFMQIRDVVIKHKKAAGFHGSARILESSLSRLISKRTCHNAN